MKRDPYLDAAHAASIFSRDRLLKGRVCGCFSCLTVFPVRRIWRWVDDQQTGLCPFCGNDALLADNLGYPLSRDFLYRMQKYWFGVPR